MVRKAVDMMGRTFGSLVVVGRAPTNTDLKSGNAHWECRCACGRTRLVRADNLRNGRTCSCGECGAVAPRSLTADTAKWHLEAWSVSEKLQRSTKKMRTSLGFSVLREPKSGAVMPESVRDLAFLEEALWGGIRGAIENGVLPKLVNATPFMRYLSEQRIVVLAEHNYASEFEVILEWERVTGRTHHRHAAAMRYAQGKGIAVLTPDGNNSVGSGQALPVNEFVGKLDGWVA